MGNSASNSLASQNINPAPLTPVQPIPETVNPVQNPLVQTAPEPVDNLENKPPAMDCTKLPATWGKNILKFEGEADALPGYLDTVEDVIVKTGATTEEDKKEIAIHYCDYKTKQEWKAILNESPDSLWHDFRARI
jgi:hypothetical protein